MSKGFALAPRPRPRPTTRTRLERFDRAVGNVAGIYGFAFLAAAAYLFTVAPLIGWVTFANSVAAFAVMFWAHR